MSSRSTLAIVALAAFALGFAAAYLLPSAARSPAEDLAWERVGETVRLTAKTPGNSYLVLETGAGDTNPPGQGSSQRVSTGTVVSLQSPATVYQVQGVFRCGLGECNDCSDCPPPPPLPPSGGWLVIDQPAGLTGLSPR